MLNEKSCWQTLMVLKFFQTPNNQSGPRDLQLNSYLIDYINNIIYRLLLACIPCMSMYIQL